MSAVLKFEYRTEQDDWQIVSVPCYDAEDAAHEAAKIIDGNGDHNLLNAGQSGEIVEIREIGKDEILKFKIYAEPSVDYYAEKIP